MILLPSSPLYYSLFIYHSLFYTHAHTQAHISSHSSLLLLSSFPLSPSIKTFIHLSHFLSLSLSPSRYLSSHNKPLFLSTSLPQLGRISGFPGDSADATQLPDSDGEY